MDVNGVYSYQHDYGMSRRLVWSPMRGERTLNGGWASNKLPRGRLVIVWSVSNVQRSRVWSGRLGASVMSEFSRSILAVSKYGAICFATWGVVALCYGLAGRRAARQLAKETPADVNSLTPGMQLIRFRQIHYMKRSPLMIKWGWRSLILGIVFGFIAISIRLA
jgi:hypothetical protein